MRVIAGQFRSRALQAPAGMATRPTSDRLRETLFNVLQSRIEGARVLDLYAGSGAVGIEAISRGAAWVHFAENAPAAVRSLRANFAALRITGGYALEDRSVARALAECVSRAISFDLVYLDPPYGAAEEYAATLSALARHAAVLLRPDALVIAEHSRASAPAEHVPGADGAMLQRGRLLRQGDACLSFYSVVSAS